MQILECRSVREKQVMRLKKEIGFLSDKLVLVVIQIGKFLENDKYLSQKRKLAQVLGVEIREYFYDRHNSKEEIIDKIIECNCDDEVTGIMIQKPILDGFDYQELVDFINVRKDVDGVTTKNKERIVNGDKNAIIPCTAKAVLMVMDAYGISCVNKKIVIVGKSNLSGLPLFYLLKDRNSVTLCDSKTVGIMEIIKEADVVIVGIGKPKYFSLEYFRSNQIVIDIGTTYLDGKLVGDVDFEKVSKLVFMITPVPGGVGQLTVVSLFDNLLTLKKTI